MIAPLITAPNLIAALLTLVPYLAAAFFPSAACAAVRKFPVWAQLACPSLLSIPYVLVTCAAGDFRWSWLALYALLPVAITILLWHAQRIDTAQRGNWRDFFVLGVLGLAVDLRWLEPAWPAHLAVFSKILLLDAGIYAFLAIRQLDGVGFDLRLRLSDLGIGLREAAFYTPIALAIGLGLGFLHTHAVWPGIGAIAFAWFFTFFFIAVPEELFFRGWLQNLLERRMGRYPALFLTAALFGLAHFNKRAVHFNWRYVLMAAIAGIFYGRAWRSRRRVGASAVTHATVDSIWSLWLR
ncbi:MAG TPA: CPBP family intramembrane glutamic endopeptidase [Terracidiphilus sp.]|nr:CPBP family intramembrane glutamic endopeptidase [Terracidiphilus sp.]